LFDFEKAPKTMQVFAKGGNNINSHFTDPFVAVCHNANNVDSAAIDADMDVDNVVVEPGLAATMCYTLYIPAKWSWLD